MKQLLRFIIKCLSAIGRGLLYALAIAAFFGAFFAAFWAFGTIVTELGLPAPKDENKTTAGALWLMGCVYAIVAIVLVVKLCRWLAHTWRECGNSQPEHFDVQR